MAVSIIGEAAVRLRPETTGFQGEAESGVLGGIGSLAKKGAALLGGIFIGKEVVDGIKSFYDAAEESAKIGRLTAQVIQSTGGAAQLTAQQVGDLATAVSNKTGMDDEAIQSGENLLLTFTNIRNAAGKGNDIFNQTTQIMTDMAAALGTDASGSAIQLGKALNDPINGVTALTRVGVSFTDQQKAQIKTLADSGDLLGAQKIILGELNKEFGGAAAAASSPLDKLKVQLGNLQEAIGGNLIPIANNFANFAMNTLLPAFMGLSDAAGQAFDILFHGDFTSGPLAEDSGVVDILFKIRDGILNAYNAVQTFVHSDSFAAWVQIAKDAAAALWAGLQAVVGFVVHDLIPAFVDVGKAVFQVAEYFRQHQGAATALGIVVGVVAALVVAAWVMQAAAAVASSAASVAAWFAVAVGAREGGASSTRSTAQVVFGWIAAGAAAVWNAALVVAAWVASVAQTGVLMAMYAAESISSAATSAAAWAANAAGVVASWVMMAAAATVNAVAVGAVWLAQTIASTATVVASWAVSVATVVGGWIVMAATALVQAAAMAAAWFIALGPVGWIIAAVIGLVALIVANWDTVKGWTIAAWNAIVGAVVGAWNWLTGAVSAGVSAVVSFVTGLPGRILGALGSFGALLWSKGVELMQGLVNGIASAAGFVGNVARNIVNAVIGFINRNVIDGINGLLDFTIMGVHINPPDIPHIPTLHEGGIFTAPGGEGLALLRSQELVVTPEQRVVADNLLRDLLSGAVPAVPGGAAAGGAPTVNNYITQQPGESGAALAARVTQGTVWNLNNGITRTVGAPAGAPA